MNQEALFVATSSLYSLEERQVAILREYGRAKGWNEFTSWLDGILALSPSQLLSAIEGPSDEEEKEHWIIAFLWRQKKGEVPANFRLRYTFHHQYLAWLPYRYMSANGYEEVEDLPIELDRSTTCAAEIQRLLTPEMNPELWDVDDWKVLLACLSVLGPRLAATPYLGRARALMSYICEAHAGSEWSSFIRLEDFTMLMHDLNWPAERGWSAWKELTATEENRHVMWSFPGWYLGTEMYGSKALARLREVEIPFDVDLLKDLVALK
jgi:hypothetical protein